MKNAALTIWLLVLCWGKCD